MTAEEFVLFDKIIKSESGWRPFVKNPTSSAYGLCQRMMSIHTVDSEKYMTDPYAQVDWCIGYIMKTYGGYPQAWNFWLAHKWF